MNRWTALFCVVAVCLTFMFVQAPSAQASIKILDDWTIDLGGVVGQGLGPSPNLVTPIDEVFYTGYSFNTLFDVGVANGVPDPGDHARIQGLLVATGLSNDLLGMFNTGGIGGHPDDKGLGTTWDLTFAFDVEVVYNFTPIPGDLSFSHVAAGAGITPATGTLDIYIDGPGGGEGLTLAGASVPAAQWTDAALIASFLDAGGQGGVFHTLTLDGSDDALFFDVIPSSIMPGVLFDKNGVDLSTYPPNLLTLAITDSNLDADPLATGSLGNVPGVPVGFGAAPPETLANFNVKEDGSARLGVIPEPASMLVWGLLALSALGLLRLRRTR
jgi:hypothetical protein